MQIIRIDDLSTKKKKKNAFGKSSTAKLSWDNIGDEPEPVMNSNNLLVSEEKPAHLSLAKQIILLDSNLHKKSYLWREQVELLQTVKRWIKQFPIPELCILWHEALLDYARDGMKPIQYISLELVALMILHNYDMEEADSIIEHIISEFAEADSSFLKCLFVDFFEICCKLPFTIANIEDKLFEQFLNVSQCSYKSVKLRILKIIPNLKYLLTDADILEEIQSMLIRFTDDTNAQVGIKTEETKMMLFMWKKEAKTPKGQEEQKQFEDERQHREHVIKEVIKLNKVLVEERKKKEEEEAK